MMQRSSSGLGLNLFTVVLCALSLFLIPLTPVMAAEDSQFFPETGHTVSGKFLQYWKANGGLSTYGFPITDAKDEVDPETGKTFLTQWFERNRFELHPENAGIQGGKYEVLLGLLGKDLRREALMVDPDFISADPLISPAVPANQQVFFKETGHNLRLGFLDYWTKNGGLERFGYPIDEEHPEVDPETGNTFISQWFERARFEYHPENAKPYDILLGLLGNQIKSPKGNVDYAWKLGRSYNELNQPTRVAADTKGNIFVSDSNYRISKYTNTGQFLTRWGKTGSRNEEFNSIQGLSTDNSGNLYVAANRSTIKKFDGTGNYLTQWGLGNSEVVGAVATDTAGNVYVYNVSYENPNIQKFDGNGKFITKWGSKGTGDGQFNNPGDYMAIDGNSNIYVVDNLFNSDNLPRIQKFNSSGRLVTKWNIPSQSGVTGFAVDGAGNSYFLSYNNIMKYSNSGQLLGSFGKYGSKDGQINNARGIAVDVQGNLFVADTLNDRISKFNNQGQPAGSWGNRVSSTEPGKFVIPDGTIIDTQGNLQVLDEFNHRVQKFDRQGNYLGSWGDVNKFGYPYMIVSDQHGNINLVDNNQTDYSIQTFDLNGNSLGKISIKQGTGDGELSYLVKLAIDKAGNLFLIDQNFETDNVRVQKLDSTGKFIRKWGNNGSDDGQFKNPSAIAIDSQSNVYVSDSGNNRIQKFDNDGKLLAKWNRDASQSGFYISIMAIDNQDNIYVFNEAGSQILKFNQAGQIVLRWGGRGSAEGQFSYVNSITLDDQHNIYVTDGSLFRVQKFRQR